MFETNPQPLVPNRCPQAGSSTVGEHSADIRETVVRLHLGLLNG